MLNLTTAKMRERSRMSQDTGGFTIVNDSIYMSNLKFKKQQNLKKRWAWAALLLTFENVNFGGYWGTVGRLTSVIARIADVGGFDEQRANCYIRLGKVLTLFDSVTTKFHYLDRRKSLNNYYPRRESKQHRFDRDGAHVINQNNRRLYVFIYGSGIAHCHLYRVSGCRYMYGLYIFCIE